jgi:diacylglycerol kinase family enzyme
VIAVVNTAGGSVDAAAPKRMAQIFALAGLPNAEIFSTGTRGINKALNDAADRADVVVVLGGDGTIRTAAVASARTGKPIIPLPGGTMNLLPRALYGEIGWEQALADTLAAPVERKVSGGMAQGHAFFCAAILGAPTLWADAREALRHGRVADAVQHSLTAVRRAGESLDYNFDDQPKASAEAVVVMCPLVSKNVDADETVLEAAALDPTAAGAMFSLALRAVFDNWRADPSVSLAKVKSVRVFGQSRLPVILDGEKVRLGRTVLVSFNPVAFRALVPAAKVE